ncbi:geranylgeranyl transferase type-2 subunit alpha [Anopheles nili]|uniref:geranylgeranyl transferase type-2 subunit alpha n=1 Tax=Anopheles nili TaxID=185578 RepID=UPI00237B8521|nr:geranylgeranyl transferase type-2 subunit alpha [Anopheles nili]
MTNNMNCHHAEHNQNNNNKSLNKHGRLKVRTSAEEAARKKLEQQQKVKAFRGAMGRIMAKKSAEEYDAEMMELTSKILSNHPDVATLWNLRRMCILAQKESDTDNIQCVFDKDLRFTETCLMVNPKSYCAWHHRSWVLENAPTANWQTEVELCTKYLKLDERNFHCWDYRRYVVEKANVTPEKEFDFCTEKIEKNFSNYSSWHYRSKLLPVLYPNTEDPSRPISEEKLKEELELVLTAAFTDPNDSSAWFYQRWLLGYSQPELDLVACRIDASQNLAVVAFSQPVNLTTGGFTLNVSCCDGCNDTSKWMPTNEESTFAVTWVLKSSFVLNESDNPTVSLQATDGASYMLDLHAISDQCVVGVKKPKTGYVFGSAIVDVLKAQLASCHELLEYEPDSKWTLLTAALLMKAIDRRGYHDTIRHHLTKLESVDFLRAGYYQDLASKWTIETKLENWIEAGNLTAEIDLSGMQLTVMNYVQYLATSDAVDLSQNRLVDRNLGVLRDLVFCRRLNLSGNDLETAAAIKHLSAVEKIVLKDNEKLIKNETVIEELKTKVSNITL